MRPFVPFSFKSEGHQGLEPVFSAEEIQKTIDLMADKLAVWFDDEPIAQVVMNGAFMFAADLIRALSHRGVIIEMDFIRLEKNRREGKVNLVAANDRSVEGRDVVIIDGVFEHGRTLEYATQHFNAQGARTVTSCILLDKSQGRQTQIRPDFVGFECPDHFMVGYGLDLGHRYRELPFIARLGQA